MIHPILIHAIVPKIAALVLTAAATGGVPSYNIDGYCRSVAKNATPVSDPEPCIHDERMFRDQLVKEWSEFSGPSKSFCGNVSSMGGAPTYTELLTCLELDRDRKNQHADNGVPGVVGQ